MPTHADYLEAIGRAMFRWAQAEWAIIYLAEELHPEGRTGHRSATMTSGEIVQQLHSAIAATKAPESTLADAKSLLYEYDTLVPRRNDIVHAQPAAIAGEQRLYRVRPDGTREGIEVDDLVAFSTDCTRLGNQASALLWKLRQGESG